MKTTSQAARLKKSSNTILREALELYKKKGDVSPEDVYKHLRSILDLNSRASQTDLDTIQRILVQGGWVE